MPDKADNVPTSGPEAKCCLGVTYFNRSMERRGDAPRCMGLAQFKQGEQDNDDVRTLNGATADFKYYCVGYSSHPLNTRPSPEGRPTQMPFCEGVEIAITEERTSVAAGKTEEAALMRGPLSIAPEHDNTTPLPPAATGDSEDRSVQTRFRKHLLRNTDSLWSTVTGSKLPTLPVEFRKFDNLIEARTKFMQTASVNFEKMRVMAQFISHRTKDAAKPIWERFGSEEETE